MSDEKRDYLTRWTLRNRPGLANQMIQIVNHGSISAMSASAIDLAKLVEAAFDAGVIHTMETRSHPGGSSH